MCISDWQLGRLVRSLDHYLDLDAATIIIPPNTQRVGLFISCLAEVPDTWVRLRFNDAIGDWHNLAANDRWIMFTLREHGDIVQKEVRFNTSNAPEYVLIKEFLMPEEYLSVPPDKFDVPAGRY